MNHWRDLSLWFDWIDWAKLQNSIGKWYFSIQVLESWTQMDAEKYFIVLLSAIVFVCKQDGVLNEG